MYPSGVGTSYADPRRSNNTKSQSLQYNQGFSGVKDMSESTANSNPFPRDSLGTNLRRGRGLTFNKGIAQFSGFVDGKSFAPAHSRPAMAAENNQVPNYDAYMSHSRSSPHHSNSNGQYLDSRTIYAGNNSAPDSIDPPARADDDPRSQSGHYSSRGGSQSGSRPPSVRYLAAQKYRPQSAPAARQIDPADLPDWAKQQVFTPTWDKTVDNAKSRPGSARVRPTSGLPLSYVPKWISQDKKVLSFEAFFKEAVQESRIEHYRVRRCVVQYFLEDDTFKISEPREENSGIPQGSFLKRHKVARPDGSGYMTWRDLDVPGDLTIYGRTFRITKCDEFTINFYASKGINLSPPEEVPADPVRSARSRPSSAIYSRSPGRDGRDPGPFHGRLKNDMSEYIEARLGKCQDKKALVTKYLVNDRKVLRFYCSWDDKTPDGVVEKRPFILHFFLADDTVEVLEVKVNNNGRDPFPALLKRMKLPKGYKGVSTVGGSINKEQYYSASDLQVGGVVSVFGRQLIINDCDEATRRYYEDECGVRVDRPNTADDKDRRPKSAVIIPPHNGFGKEEDSRQNCISLHPKPPKVNVIRLLENKGKLLRFIGKFEHAVGFDMERSFTISYFLDTDEFAVFEPPVKNSGRTGGKFMERSKLRKPNSSEHFEETDLFLGARIVVYSRRFVLVDADEFTVKYMEDHPDVFPFSDVRRIYRKLQGTDLSAVTNLLRGADKYGAGRVSGEAFRQFLLSADVGLNDQEVFTLSRHLADGRDVKYEALVDMANQGVQHHVQEAADEGGSGSFEDAQDRLRKVLYKRGPSGLRGLQRAMMHISRGSGAIDRADFDTVLGFCGVNMPDNLVSALFARYDRGEGVVEGIEMIAGLRPKLSRNQEKAVLAVFETLEDPTFKTGAVDIDEVFKKYKPARHPRVIRGEISETEATRELEDGLEGSDGAILATDMCSFYADVVAGYRLTDDQLFDMLRSTWGLSGRAY